MQTHLDGQKLGRYKLVKMIGRGGMGMVYEARDLNMARKVAVKILQADMDPTTNTERTRLFRREMQAISALDYPHILPLFDFGEEPDEYTSYLYMVMPLREESSLDRWLQKDNNATKLSLEDIAHLIRQAADALQYAHNQKIIHLDVKPANFLVGTTDNPHRPYLLLADFGLAKFTEATRGDTKTMGTGKYMAPEQWEGKPQAATDQYSLGIMTYELLTGKVPFEGDGAQIMYQHIHITPQPPSTLNTTLPPIIDEVILRALAKNPAERFPSISTFADALENAVRSTQKGQDQYLRFTISETEAMVGMDYPLTLEGGKTTTLKIPANTTNGQKIRLAGMGKSAEGLPCDIVATVIVKPTVDKDQLVAQQLKALSKRVEALRTNGSQNQAVLQQLQHISRDISALQAKGSLPTRGNRISASATLLIALIVVLAVIGANAVLFNALNQSIVSNGNSNAQAISTTNVRMTAITNAQATATIIHGYAIATAAVRNANPYPTYFPSDKNAVLTLYDPLNGSQNYWKSYNNNPYGNCIVGYRSYSINTSASEYPCSENDTQPSNFAFEIQVSNITGSYPCGGVIFRGNYYFEFCVNHLPLTNIKGHPNDSSTDEITTPSNSHIISVWANSGDILIYLDHQQVFSSSGNTPPKVNTVGLVAGTFYSGSTTTTFNNAKVWKL